ncbi:MAG: sigma-70 family RNA polymerase sigma factor [Pirellulales bacterium]
MSDPCVTTQALIERARTGNQAAVAELFKLHEHRLRLMIRARMNSRLRRRLDEDDVLQDAFLEASERLPTYLEDPQAPFFLWLRQIVHWRIHKVHQQHLGHKVRDARREVSLRQAAPSGASSGCLANLLLGSLTSPSRAAMRGETRARLEEVLDGMSDIDREILSSRHFEQLSNREVACELGIDTSTASKRYVRALLRLEKALTELGMGAEQLESSDK